MSDDNEKLLASSRACAFEARAWVDDKLVAVSKAARQLELPDGSPILCFPHSDVMADVQRELPKQDEVLVPSDLVPMSSGYLAFDHRHKRVRVMLVDAGPGEPERDHTLKRFPVWGDAADLIKVLDVRRDDSDGRDGPARYVSVPHVQRGRAVVEGSQMLAQSIVAAGRHAPGRRAVHTSMMFLRAANANEPLHILLDEQSSGKTFTSLAVKVVQGDKLCASGVMLLDVMAPDVMRHAAKAPETKGPYESVPRDMSVTNRDVRFVDGAYTGDPDAPVGPPELDAWVRFRNVPDDPYIHAGLLAQFTGHVSIATAMRPHAGIGQNQAHRTLSTAINAIHLSLHDNVRADQWMLYHHVSTFAGNGMTHSECRAYNSDGQLLASFSVDAMVRAMATDRPVNDKTSL